MLRTKFWLFKDDSFDLGLCCFNTFDSLLQQLSQIITRSTHLAQWPRSGSATQLAIIKFVDLYNKGVKLPNSRSVLLSIKVKDSTPKL
jgi:hypothetical protein